MPLLLLIIKSFALFCNADRFLHTQFSRNLLTLHKSTSIKAGCQSSYMKRTHSSNYLWELSYDDINLNTAVVLARNVGYIHMQTKKIKLFLLKQW
jgi:hypothetical protein